MRGNLGIPYAFLTGVLCTVVVVTEAAAGPITINGFTGPYDPSNWTLTNDAGLSGTIDTSGAPASVMMTSDISNNPGQTSYSILAAASGTAAFDYDFANPNEPEGHYPLLAFGGVFFIPASGKASTAGHWEIPVTAGDLIGFAVGFNQGSLPDSPDINTPSTLTITNFSAPAPDSQVPEPASMTILGGGLACLLIGVGIRRRRHRA